MLHVPTGMWFESRRLAVSAGGKWCICASGSGRSGAGGSSGALTDVILAWLLASSAGHDTTDVHEIRSR